MDGSASCVSLVSQPGVVKWERFVAVEALLMGTRGAGRAVCTHPLMVWSFGAGSERGTETGAWSWLCPF